MMRQNLNIITLGVTDLDRSSKFYEVDLGWKRSEMSQGNIIFFDLSGLLLSLYPIEKLNEETGFSPPQEPNGRLTLALNARSKIEVDQIFSHLKSIGANITHFPREVFWGGYSGYFQDPDGHVWEVAYNPYLKIAENGTISTE